jgi:hypothetical protein
VLTYRDLKDELLTTIVGLEGVKNRGKLVSIEFYCKNIVSIANASRTELLDHFSLVRSSMLLSGKNFQFTIYDGTNDLLSRN